MNRIFVALSIKKIQGVLGLLSIIQFLSLRYLIFFCMVSFLLLLRLSEAHVVTERRNLFVRKKVYRQIRQEVEND